MKAIKNFRLLIVAMIIALFTGCAGITEANLDDAQALDAPATSIDNTVESTDAPGYFDSSDQESMIDVRPETGYEDRE